MYFHRSTQHALAASPEGLLATPLCFWLVSGQEAELVFNHSTRRLMQVLQYWLRKISFQLTSHSSRTPVTFSTSAVVAQSSQVRCRSQASTLGLSDAPVPELLLVSACHRTKRLVKGSSYHCVRATICEYQYEMHIGYSSMRKKRTDSWRPTGAAPAWDCLLLIIDAGQALNESPGAFAHAFYPYITTQA
jgi:hypothetical protein